MKRNLRLRLRKLPTPPRLIASLSNVPYGGGQGNLQQFVGSPVSANRPQTKVDVFKWLRIIKNADVGASYVD